MSFVHERNKNNIHDTMCDKFDIKQSALVYCLFVDIIKMTKCKQTFRAQKIVNHHMSVPSSLTLYTVSATNVDSPLTLACHKC